MLLAPTLLLMLLSLFALARWPSWVLLLLLVVLGGAMVTFAVAMFLPQNGKLADVLPFTDAVVGGYLFLGACVIWLTRSARRKRGA